MATNNDVRVLYEDCGGKETIKEISFELIEDTKVTLSVDGDSVKMCMSDTISENEHLEGNLTYDKLCTLIKGLSRMKNQMKIQKGE